MSMRRHILIAERYALLCRLLEGREEAIQARFQPVIAKQVPQMPWPEIALIASHDGGHQPVQIPTLVNGEVHNTEAPASYVISNDRRAGRARLPVEAQAEFDTIRDNLIADTVIRMIWAADPNPKKAFATWMLTRFCAKNPADRLALEDLDRITGYLKLFERVKNRLPEDRRDVNRFRSVADLFDAIKDFRENDGGEIVSNSFEQQMLAQAVMIYNGPDYEIVSPNTKEASMFFGRGTEWCTAYAPPRTNNLFDSYNSRGPLYIVVDKKTGDKWQFHPVGQEFRDASDRSINIGNFLHNHPVVKQAFDRYFNVKPWDVVGRYDSGDGSVDPIYYYYGHEGDRQILAVAGEGWVPGGLIGRAPLIKIAADSDGNIVGADSNKALDHSKLEGFIAALNKVGFHGDTPWMTDNEVYWTGDRFGSFLDLPVIAETDNIQVRRVGTGNTVQLHFSEVNVGKIVDDICTIKGGTTSFLYKDHRHRNEFLVDESPEAAFFAQTLIKFIPESASFERPESDGRLPRSSHLLEARPQWIDLGYLYAKTGETEMVKDRLGDWLKGSDSNIEIPDGGDYIVLKKYSDIDDLIDDEGNDDAKYVMKVMRSEEHLDGGWEHIDVDDHLADLLNSLRKNQSDLFTKLCRYIEKNCSDEMEESDLEAIETVSDIEQLVDDTGEPDDLKDAVRSAVADGNARGAENEMSEALSSAILSNGHIGVIKDGKVEPVTNMSDMYANLPIVAIATVKQIMASSVVDLNDVEAEEPSPYEGWMKELDAGIDITEPHYGWQDYDSEAAEERFGDLIHDMV